MGIFAVPSHMVEAHRLVPENSDDLQQWTDGVLVEEINDETGEKNVGLNIPTRNGPRRVSEGDWVLKLPDGTFKKCSDTEFELNYTQIG